MRYTVINKQYDFVKLGIGPLFSYIDFNNKIFLKQNVSDKFVTWVLDRLLLRAEQNGSTTNTLRKHIN